VSLVRKRAVGEALMSISGLAVLVATLAAMDERMREQVMLRVNGDPAAQLSNASATVQSLTATILTAVRDQSIEHAPLVIFVVIGAVLLLFMLRT
jgi:hypothetical protein